MSYNSKNYSEQGGNKLVIGGTLEIQEGATVTGLDSAGGELSPATATELGGIMAEVKTSSETVEVKIGADNKLYVPSYPTIAPQEDSPDDKSLLTDFNALLAKLRASGIMAD